MSLPYRLALLALAALLACGCESESGKELKKRPASRESSAKIALPAGGRWSSAVMVTETGSYEQARGGRGGIGTATFYFARTTLLLALSGGGETRMPLPSGSVESGDADAALAASDRKWRLAAPPDGRGVAFAPEGVEEWRWVCCETSTPFHCPHLLLELRAGVDPWEKGPRFVDLASALMAPPAAGSVHPNGLDPDEWRELATAAVEYPALVHELAGAALREKSGLSLETVEGQSLRMLQQFVAGGTSPSSGDAGRSAASIRDSARAALQAPRAAGAVVTSNAALLLALSRDGLDQRALAEALLSQDWAPPATIVRDMKWPRAVAWSLARSLDPLDRIPDDVETSMVAFLDREKGEPEAALPVVSALVAHGSPGTLKKLQEMSVPDPDGGTQGKADPAWPATLDDLWQAGVVDHGALTHPIDAWIRAALKARKRD